MEEVKEAYKYYFIEAGLALFVSFTWRQRNEGKVGEHRQTIKVRLELGSKAFFVKILVTRHFGHGAESVQG